VTVIGTANPCKIERVGAIPSTSTTFNYPVAQQNQERFPAKEEAASAILAGITIFMDGELDYRARPVLKTERTRKGLGRVPSAIRQFIGH
jgi:hypothetical protein